MELAPLSRFHSRGPTPAAPSRSSIHPDVRHNRPMRCPILVGRREPAALMAAAIGRLSGQRSGGGPGRGGALVLAGEAGVGKSWLAEHMCDVAVRARIRVVT